MLIIILHHWIILSGLKRSIYMFTHIYTPISQCILPENGHYQTTIHHNWPLQAFNKDYGLASHTTHDVVCVNFLREWQDLQFNRFLRNFFIASFLFLPRIFGQKSAERKSSKKYFSYFIFDDWPGIRTQAFASNKPTHYILEHDDLVNVLKKKVKIR